MNLDFRSAASLEGALEFSRHAGGSHVCADCRFAQLFALQPRTVCTHADERRAGKVQPASQPACRAFAPRDDVDLTLSIWAAAAQPAISARAA